MASFMFQGGEKGAKQFQEDSFLSWRSPNQVITIGVIYDGHGGYNGMVASNTARDHSIEFFNGVRDTCEHWLVEKWHEELAKLFDTIHQKIRTTLLEQSQDRQVDENGVVRTLNGDPIHGGCTGTVVVQIKNPNGSSTIINANVGDSLAMLCFLDDISPEKRYHILSVDHGPENVDEFRRIQSLPSDKFPTKLLFVYDKTNIFRKYDCPLVFNEQGKKDERYEKNPWGNGLHPTNVRYEVAMYMTTPREILRDTTCIAMTRALGDFYAHPFGLTHVPSITTYELPANRKCVVAVASDGIWDCWIFNDFSDYFHETITQKREMKQVLDESITRAVANFGAKHYDDAALVSWVIEPEATQSDASAIANAVVDAIVDVVVDAIVDVVADAVVDAVETEPVQITEGSFGIKKAKLE